MSTPSWGEMTRIFGCIGLLSFGGPAAQIALMHRELVEERTWLNGYHADCRDKLAAQLSPEIAAWLESATAPL